MTTIGRRSLGRDTNTQTSKIHGLPCTARCARRRAPRPHTVTERVSQTCKTKSPTRRGCRSRLKVRAFQVARCPHLRGHARDRCRQPLAASRTRWFYSKLALVYSATTSRFSIGSCVSSLCQRRLGGRRGSGNEGGGQGIMCGDPTRSPARSASPRCHVDQRPCRRPETRRSCRRTRGRPT